MKFKSGRETDVDDAIGIDRKGILISGRDENYEVMIFENGELTKLTSDERRELAEEMISRWNETLKFAHKTDSVRLSLLRKR